jgi:preprotein translocase subunit SecA
MITQFLKKIVGSRNDRLLRKYHRITAQINALESDMARLSDTELAAKTPHFKQRYAQGETLDALLPEAFAVVREAGKRVLGMRHFDVQMLGGMVLHDGKIAEMRTGEGKTLVATLPAYLNALSGEGVHIVTVNDYLASRDAQWMGQLHNFLGLSVGVILSQMDHSHKQAAYAADITYGTNNEFGFDYLRDNMAYAKEDRFQRRLAYALVDEVDSILIDEARTPLIISGQAEDHTDLYLKLNGLPALLEKGEAGQREGDPDTGDYVVDLKAHSVLLTEAGHEKAEQILVRLGLLPADASLYAPAHIGLVHHLYAALRAHALYHRDQHYVVQNNEVIIVDEFTGRLMAGRRWSEGLHQAVEAKEGVPIQAENQTLASITFQNFFRLYGKLAGMTGTADTEAYEFHQIYNLETVVIPTNQPMIREDANDQIYRTAKEKHEAIIADITDCHKRGQPVLVGTTSIENSELLSDLLNRSRLTHQVLNAKQHAREADIVAQAGRPGVITIATNMAGRGTDIVLGGSIQKDIEVIAQEANLPDDQKKQKIDALRHEWKKRHKAVVEAGGLHIIGSERHESRRIDNQLRGRSGRQGDPGSSRFYLCLEDPLLKIFAGERLNSIMVRLKMPEGEAIEHPLVTRSLESAQRKVEQRNFDIRKQLLEYDDVANDQRKVIYAQRNELLDGDDVGETITAMRRGVLTELFRVHIPAESVEEQWDIGALETALAAQFHLSLPIGQWLRSEPTLSDTEILDRLLAAGDARYAERKAPIETNVWSIFERNVMLQALDTRWREHLSALDHLRQGIHLRSYAQKNPKQEYKREAFELFSALLDHVRSEVTQFLMTVDIRTESDAQEAENHAPRIEHIEQHHPDFNDAANPDMAASPRQPARAPDKVGRNDPCPCGSGRKYKHCHGRLQG